jgi:tRNA pseudouridine32 synthase/23S rRNA pseudouridine746 synthase
MHAHDPLETPHEPPSVRAGVAPSVVGLPPGPWSCWLDFFAARFAHVPRAEWRQRLERGDVRDAQGLPLAPEAPYRAHGKAWYYRTLAQEAHVPFEAEVLFRDAHLLVVDKPHWLAVTPGGRHLHETLLVRLKHQLGLPSLQPLHRIDRETAGLVLFGLQVAERGAYQALFRERRMHKTYEAVAPLRADLALPLVRESRLEQGTPFFRQREAEGLPNAVTRIALREQAGDWGLYQLEPLTGQRHQLRVHMAALGLPIRFDAFYPEVLRGPDAPDEHARPLQLLARTLAFEDPVTGEARRFESRRSLAWFRP